MSKITFGKHKGTDVLDLPTEYLEWLETIVCGAFREEVKQEIEKRKNPEKGVTTRLPESEFMEKLAGLLIQCPEKLFDTPYRLKTVQGDFIFEVKRKF